MNETHTTRAFTRCMSVSVLVLMATTLGVAVVPDRNRNLTSGVGGSVAMELSDSLLALADASAIQPDGKIIAAGAVILTGPDSAFRLVRYNQDGSLDTTFGIKGKITTDFSEGADNAAAVAIQSDGKIIAAGYAGFMPGGTAIVLRLSATTAMARWIRTSVSAAKSSPICRAPPKLLRLWRFNPTAGSLRRGRSHRRSIDER